MTGWHGLYRRPGRASLRLSVLNLNNVVYKSQMVSFLSIKSPLRKGGAGLFSLTYLIRLNCYLFFNRNFHGFEKGRFPDRDVLIDAVFMANNLIFQTFN